MTKFTDYEVINDWLDFIDNKLMSDHYQELGYNRKTLVLDSIEVLDYIRKTTSDLDISADNRIQYLLGLCDLPCRNDYYHRFLKFNSTYYRTQNDWWVDCWQTIRMKNTLHKFELVDINIYLKEASDGEYFAEKWPKFYIHSKNNKEKTSLAAYSYLECIRFLLNIGNGQLDDTCYSELKIFLNKLCEYNGSGLKYFRLSNEIRANSLNLIASIKNSFQDHELDEIYENTKNILIKMIDNAKWNMYSSTWSTFFIYELDDDILNMTKSKIPDDFLVDTNWISSYNHTHKPRYALLAAIDKLDHCNFFDLLRPNTIAYTPNYKYKEYREIISILDKSVQALKEIRDIQRIVQDGNIDENYFRDLIKYSISPNADEEIRNAEKEAYRSSGRTTDILIVRRSRFDIPIEVKILWRFKSDAYEPINEILEQMTDGNFGFLVIINPPNNPTYHGKYQGFRGWKSYVEDHATYVDGTIREDDYYYGELKSKSTFSEHISSISGRQRTVTLLSLFIDLSEYIRSPHLSTI